MSVPIPEQQINPPVGFNNAEHVTEQYDYSSAIKRRSDNISAIGDSANQYSQQLADRRAQVAQQASTNRINALSDDGTTQTGIASDGSVRSRLVSGAAAFKGTNYVWGGSKPGGFDCSGLIQYVYGKMGVNMPRVSQQQATQGSVTAVNKLQQGDFVAWGNSPATAHHIAIYAGNGMVWESPHSGAQVRLRKISPSESGIMGIHLKI